VTGNWQLTKQIAYRTETGDRIPEVQAYGRDSLLVEEAAFSTTAGNSEELYAVKNVGSAPDVSRRDAAGRGLPCRCPGAGRPGGLAAVLRPFPVRRGGLDGMTFTFMSPGQHGCECHAVPGGGGRVAAGVSGAEAAAGIPKDRNPRY
jgi:hypothetical protein